MESRNLVATGSEARSPDALIYRRASSQRLFEHIQCVCRFTTRVIGSRDFNRRSDTSWAGTPRPFERSECFVLLIHLMPKSRLHLNDISIVGVQLLCSEKRTFRILGLLGEIDRLVRFDIISKRRVQLLQFIDKNLQRLETANRSLLGMSSRRLRALLRSEPLSKAENLAFARFR